MNAQGAQSAAQGEAPRTAEELGAVLSPKHRQFADIYLSNGFNAAAAARAVDYKNPTEGPRLLRREDVGAYVRARQLEQQLGPEYVRGRLEYFAASDMRDFLRIAPSERSYWVRADQHEEVREAAKRRGTTADALDNYDLAGIVGGENVAQTEHGELLVCIRRVDAEVLIDWRQAEQAQALGKVKKLKISKDGSVEFELHDPVRANELLGKVHKMFTEKVEHSGEIGVIGIDIVPPEDDA